MTYPFFIFWIKKSNKLADVVGTALKTLSLRIRGAKSDLEEAGLETDGMADSVSKLRTEIQKLTGVDIMIDDNTFKSTYQILKEISAVWNNLTDVTQANVLELMFAKRQTKTCLGAWKQVS